MNNLLRTKIQITKAASRNVLELYYTLYCDKCLKAIIILKNDYERNSAIYLFVVFLNLKFKLHTHEKNYTNLISNF